MPKMEKYFPKGVDNTLYWNYNGCNDSNKGNNKEKGANHMTEAKYPVLVSEIAKRGLRKTAMAKRLGMDSKSFYNKLNGNTEFAWPEIKMMRNEFFPDMKIEDLMA